MLLLHVASIALLSVLGEGSSHVALSEVSMFSSTVSSFFSSFSLLLLRVKGRGCHTLLKPYETNCELWIWALQIKFDWLILASLTVTQCVLCGWESEINRESEQEQQQPLSAAQRSAMKESLRSFLLCKDIWIIIKLWWDKLDYSGLPQSWYLIRYTIVSHDVMKKSKNDHQCIFRIPVLPLVLL